MITILHLDHSTIKFPCGELHVRIDFSPMGVIRNVDIHFEYEKNEDIIELLLIGDALKRHHVGINRLTIPYIPFSRQDRVTNHGEAFSLAVFASLINSLGANEVIMHDPHSDVTPALINNAHIVHQWEIFETRFPANGSFWLISPDAGALKKIHTLATKVQPSGVIECSKIRNTETGALVGHRVPNDDLRGYPCYIVDDICDGGGTFINIAKELRKNNAGKIVLMVTHGFFTKGLEVFEGLIDEIHVAKGQVKP